MKKFAGDVMKPFLALTLSLLLPACGHKSINGIDAPPGGFSNPQQVTVDLSNEDSIPYDLSLWEYVNGSPSFEVRIAWPIAAKTGGSPTSLEGTADLHADSAVYTHKITLYLTSGVLVDSQAFVKLNGQLLLVTTTQAGKMTITPTQF
jgi:hypothetical protein